MTSRTACNTVEHTRCNFWDHQKEKDECSEIVIEMHRAMNKEKGKVVEDISEEKYCFVSFKRPPSLVFYMPTYPTPMKTKEKKTDHPYNTVSLQDDSFPVSIDPECG